MGEKEVEEIEKMRQELKEIRMKFHQFYPQFLEGILKWCAEGIPKEKFRKFLEDIKNSTETLRKDIIELWTEKSSEILRLLTIEIKTHSGELEKAEKIGLAILNLMKEAFLLTIEELKLNDFTKEKIEKAMKKLDEKREK